jgi:DNA polymerase-3 subunit delta'
MAANEADDGIEVALAPAAAPMLERAGVPWLEPLRGRISAMRREGRMPHGFLLTGAPGAGQGEVALWLAAEVLCRASGERPCRQCADCRLILAGSHPDLHWVGVLPDKKEISIDQLRALAATLSMRSYRSGAKVAVIAPAEAMSLKAFNALLKTLEEPPQDTYLVLAASRIDRVPKTVLSRCVRLVVPLPDEKRAHAWLLQQRESPDWAALLALAGGAPFLALDYERDGLGTVEAEMQEALDAAAAGRLDFVAFAAHCAKNAPVARLAWLESWLTRSLKDATVASDLVNDNRLPWLRPPGRDTKIRAGFALLDRLREARRDAGSALNLQLLFEGLAVSLAALVGQPAGESRGNAG